MASTRIADIIVPEIFTGYAQQITEEKTRIIQSGALARDGELDALLAAGGLTFNSPSYVDLDNVDENIPTDTQTDSITPHGVKATAEIAVRLSRNNAWGASDLASSLAGNDPMNSIAQRVGTYWARRLQAATLATGRGIFAHNATATSADHVQNDMTFDVSGSAYVEGVTDFSAPAFIDAAVTMGDSMEDLGLVIVHSIVYARMQKNNLIDFIPDSEGRVRIPTFLGREVVVDDGMPSNGGVFESWIFGNGALRLGMGTPKTPVAVTRDEKAFNGAGEEVLTNRVEWTIHPVGYAYIGATPPVGGPSNAATSGNLAHAGSWGRVFNERKQIKIARLITREF